MSTMCILFYLMAPPSMAAEEPAERRAMGHLSREVPAWLKENRCYSCHNNGDGARALYVASRNKIPVPPGALESTTEWLSTPARWSADRADSSLNDKRLARIQFSAALVEAVAAGFVKEGTAVTEAAKLLRKDQQPDGSWQGDTGTPAGSPVTYNEALATHLARKVLLAAGETAGAEQASQWLRRKTIESVPDAGAVALAIDRRDGVQYLTKHQNGDGGWGPSPKAPSEVFDTALSLLALAGRADAKAAVQRGRAYLIQTQLDNGAWPETTRPSGGRSYAQHVSTCAWALMALLATAQ